MTAQINGMLYEIEAYQTENLGTRQNPEMYLNHVVTTQGTIFYAEDNEIEISYYR